MSEYIKKDLLELAVIEVLNEPPFSEKKFERANALIKVIDNFPAADVEPVVRGKWVWEAPYMVCSACGRHSINRFRAAYCQHCGAKMSNPRGADERSGSGE